MKTQNDWIETAMQNTQRATIECFRAATATDPYPFLTEARNKLEQAAKELDFAIYAEPDRTSVGSEPDD